MKKYVLLYLVIVTVLLAVLFPGCSSSSSSSSSSPRQTAISQIEDIFSHVTAKDVRALKEMFLPSMQEFPELEDQLDSLTNFIHGNVVSFSETDGGKTTSSFRDGILVKEHLYGRIGNIQTDTGKTYKIYHYSVRVNAADPDEVGIYFICIAEESTYDSEVGYPEGSELEVGVLNLEE